MIVDTYTDGQDSNSKEITVVIGIWRDKISTTKELTRTSAEATILSCRYSDARCWSSASALRKLLSARKTS